MKKTIKRDLNLGSVAEQLVFNILKDAGFIPVLNKDKATRAFWDIEIECGTKFEVKYDLYSKRSGNIAIEFFNSKLSKPSGIGCTKANFWVQVIPGDNGDECWMCPVPKLISFCSQITPLKVISSGGDDNSSMYLYKKDTILEVFTKTDLSNIKKVIGK
jgi:hypothetical protein